MNSPFTDAVAAAERRIAEMAGPAEDPDIIDAEAEETPEGTVYVVPQELTIESAMLLAEEKIAHMKE